MKVPEKIYIHEASVYELTENLPYHIEYIRKDSFIEKIVKYLYDNDKGFILTEKDIEDLRKYISQI